MNPLLLPDNCSLVWLRNDLRLDDNTALATAANEGPVVALFLIPPRQWRQHQMAPIKVDLILRRLQAFSRELAQLNIPLLLRQIDDYNQAPAAIAELMQQHKLRKLHFNREYLVDEIRRDRAVTEKLQQQGLHCRSYHDALVVPPGELQTGSGSFYQVYSAFRRAWEKLISDRLPELFPAPAAQRPLALKPDKVPAQLDDWPLADSSAWAAQENRVRDELTNFTRERIYQYQQLRDLPAAAGTSGLSPWINIGALSPRRLLHEALAANRGELATGDPGPICWIRELVWREFYYHLVEACPRLVKGQAFQLHTEAVQWRHSPGDLQAWQRGMTGQPLVDAGMRQLAASGWMHNRLRMVTAMFLSKNLLLDWRLGEQHFMQQLVDGDFALNNGGWQWSASTGTDAAPYFRVFNPFNQSERFDPDGIYIKRWVPELAEMAPPDLHSPERLAKNRPADYPELMLDIKSSRKQAIEAFSILRKS